ncbi:MAG TPA: class I SAM-dependent methyltransferase [Stellaceae bacterium]|nr:class I SAM-dependent methyltransferase [Stellaceae bacterium]
MSTEPAYAYSGVDNLEIMADAVNYNAFLLGLVTAQARPHDRILDFGAGTGVLMRPLAAAGYQVSCVEPDERLRARLQADGLRAHATIAAVPPQSCDLIYTFNVLEHILDDTDAVRLLRERLRPGGRLVVYVPAFPILFSTLDRKVAHFRRYRHAGLAALLSRAGLQIERTAYQDCLGFAATLLFKLVGNDDGTINRRALILFDRCVFPLSRFLDRFTGRWIGKNLFAVARRDD